MNLRIIESKSTKLVTKSAERKLSDDSLGDTPVPMPNTEVKP